MNEIQISIKVEKESLSRLREQISQIEHRIYEIRKNCPHKDYSSSRLKLDYKEAIKWTKSYSVITLLQRQ